MRAFVFLVAWLALVGSPLPLRAQSASTAVEAIRIAQREGRLGTVSGRVYGEARRTGQAEQALTGTRVMLVPDSVELRAELARARERARASAKAHAASGVEVRAILDRHVQSLGAAGGGDLSRQAEVDDEGAFRFQQVPAGTWLLLASRAVPVERHASQASRKEREAFVLKPDFVGYDAVSLWLRELTVSADQTVLVDLSDRAVWMTAISERRGGGAGR